MKVHKEEKIQKRVSLEEYSAMVLRGKRAKKGKKHMRKAMFRNHGFNCVCCSAFGVEACLVLTTNGLQTWRVYTIDSDGREDYLTIDHIVPKSKGGKDSPTNAQPMCRRCNSQKGRKPMEAIPLKVSVEAKEHALKNN